MFTRIVELTSKAGKTEELIRVMSERVLSILKDQPGFLDQITLISDYDPHRIVAISFWKNRQQGEAYQREEFKRVTGIIINLIEGIPLVRTFGVEHSTLYKLRAAQAA